MALTRKQLEDTKTQFINKVRQYAGNREGIEDLLAWLETTDFYIAPASTIYHGAFQGGLLVHSYNVLIQYLDELELHGIIDLASKDEDNLSMIESATICAAFHDLCKINTYEPYIRNVKNNETGQWEQVEAYKREPKFPMGHGEKSIFLLNQFMLLTPYEGLAIYWHMGAYDISPYKTLNECSKAWETEPMAFLLHIADMKATYLLESRGDE